MTIVIAVLATAFVATVVIGVAAVIVIRQRKIRVKDWYYSPLPQFLILMQNICIF
jgi:energy-coupling factor transporter transmembrane protein EcfT